MMVRGNIGILNKGFGGGNNNFSKISIIWPAQDMVAQERALRNVELARFQSGLHL